MDLSAVDFASGNWVDLTEDGTPIAGLYKGNNESLGSLKPINYLN